MPLRFSTRMKSSNGNLTSVMFQLRAIFSPLLAGEGVMMSR
jgi:hypothetical protein